MQNAFIQYSNYLIELTNLAVSTCNSIDFHLAFRCDFNPETTENSVNIIFLSCVSIFIYVFIFKRYSILF